MGDAQQKMSKLEEDKDNKKQLRRGKEKQNIKS